MQAFGFQSDAHGHFAGCPALFRPIGCIFGYARGTHAQAPLFRGRLAPVARPLPRCVTLQLDKRLAVTPNKHYAQVTLGTNARPLLTVFAKVVVIAS
jgi:hypothetical protein